MQHPTRAREGRFSVTFCDIGNPPRVMRQGDTGARSTVGRPSKRSDTAAAVIVSRIAEGEGLAGALEAAGLCRAAFFRWQADEPLFGQAVESARRSAAVGRDWHPLALRLQERAVRDAQRARAKAERAEAIERAHGGDFSGLTNPADLAYYRWLWISFREPAPGFELVYREGADGVTRRHIWRERLRRPEKGSCQARTRSGERCKARAVAGKRVCRVHGGGSG